MTPTRRKLSGLMGSPARGDPAEHDQDGRNDERCAQRFVESKDRDQRRNDRRRSDEDGGARRTDVTHGAEEQDLRCAGRDHAGEHERPQVVDLAADDERPGAARDEGDRRRGECARLGVGAASGCEADRNGERAEEHGRCECEEDCGHADLRA
jgi:hypothetical protein